MIIKLNVLDAGMKNRIGSHVGSAEVVTIECDGSGNRKMKLTEKVHNPDGLNTDMSERTILNSTLERETAGCFLALQEIKLGPKKTQKREVDRRVSKQPDQSALEKA